jgi:hypothetical protein
VAQYGGMEARARASGGEEEGGEESFAISPRERKSRTAGGERYIQESERRNSLMRSARNHSPLFFFSESFPEYSLCGLILLFAHLE